MEQADKISIIDYKQTHKSGLLRLLLELHVTHFNASAPTQSLELLKEKDIKATYKKYIEQIQNDGNWKILLAVDKKRKLIGFIIGSLKRDPDLVKSHIGVLEDWLVLVEERRKGVGMKLYTELEKWFIEKRL